MRRSILVATSGIALAGAMAVGPLGAAATAPYVYGCAPAAFYANVPYIDVLTIYNGSTSAASLTTKVLAADGQILNGTLNIVLPVTWTLPVTHTEVNAWLMAAGNFPTAQNGLPAAVRVVSSVPVAVTFSQDTSDPAWPAAACSSLQP